MNQVKLFIYYKIYGPNQDAGGIVGHLSLDKLNYHQFSKCL